MDCAACGKPLSVTAKFCGKCGAPVKRPTKATESEAPVAATAPDNHSHTAPEVESVEDLVVTLSPPAAGLDEHNLMMIDLNLDSNASTTPTTPSAPPEPIAASALDADLLHRLEQHQQELKKTLEKHSLLLDFISLASQQQTHQQSQPDPNEEMLHNLIEQQTQFAVQLAELQNHIQQLPAAASGRLPEEFKLLLEKQKIEIQKSFSQNVAQNTENIASAHDAELAKVQEMLKANTLAAEGIEKNLAPLIQSVNDLKTKVQAVVKKVEEQAAAKPKQSGKDAPSDEAGGFMVFVIGMLCGLTVVLSSLAIYNFLSHDTHAPESSANAHEKAAPESSAHAKPAH